MAWLNMRQGHYTEAEQLLVKALEYSRRVLGEEHSETQACLKYFVLLCEAWGKPAEADKWRARLPREQYVKEQ